MKAFLLKNWIVILIVIGVGILAFFGGRATIVTGTTITYVKGETIHDSISKPYPVEVEIPANPVLPMTPDTIKLPGGIEYRFYKVDTLKIISEYVKRNRYTITLFDNKNGKMILTPVVQYNTLDSLGYKFTPIEKVISQTTEKIFTPFIRAGYNSFNYVSAGGGIYYHNIGIGAGYITNFKENGYEVSLQVKF